MLDLLKLREFNLIISKKLDVLCYVRSILYAQGDFLQKKRKMKQQEKNVS